MIKIAVVDDEQADRCLLEKYYSDLQKEVREVIEVSAFSSGEELLDAYNYSFDLISLDIDLDGCDGISIARKIRKLDQEVLILFVTNMAQMAINGYEVQAFDFLIKPLNYYSFSMKISNALDIIKNKKSKNIVITTAGRIRKISTDDLYYVEVRGHYLYFRTEKEILKQKASLRELEEHVKNLSFKRCNNCYLVNLKYVDGVDKDDVQIGAERLKISRPRKKEFLQALANYIGGIRL